ncbi:c-type cytochrome [Marinicella meishanensis]|uniref:c-type cytochrome n=1 Tax=Marinicella meishanensis TaxID=2873263 RepID=UPI001CBD709A|nr:c-type cytochrome [Marinicella sp. NBU2979]
MQRITIKLWVSVCLLWSMSVMADGDAENGKNLSATCAACHGTDGNSVNPIWPSLAGQHAEYLVRQLQLYKSGERDNAMMAPMAAGLSEQDMADLAAYFSSQELALKAANPDQVELGKKIYQAGDKDRNIPACMACHGPTGQGNPLSGYPILANQHAAYTVLQLKAYKAGQKTANPDDVNGQVMAGVAQYMTDEEIEAVASYLQGLQAAE